MSSDSAKNLVHVIYALQAAAFATGLTFFIAPMLIYWKQKNIKDPRLGAHIQWQLETFWYGLFWGVVGVIAFSLEIGLFILIADVLWILYRIGHGWMQLSRDLPVK